MYTSSGASMSSKSKSMGFGIPSGGLGSEHSAVVLLFFFALWLPICPLLKTLIKYLNKYIKSANASYENKIESRQFKISLNS